jgi:hypothetical protein
LSRESKTNQSGPVSPNLPIGPPLLYIPPRKGIKERLNDANAFLKGGKEEIDQGFRTADDIAIREGAEKVFHALLEATVARIQKYGLGIPQSHDEIRDKLDISGSLRKEFSELKTDYEDAFLDLHVRTYYKGWIDRNRIEKSVQTVERRIQKLDQLLKR